MSAPMQHGRSTDDKPRLRDSRNVSVPAGPFAVALASMPAGVRLRLQAPGGVDDILPQISPMTPGPRCRRVRS
jgi:hypothetical protein